MTEAAGRLQDQGRKHRRAGRPSPATVSLLGEYQDAMRDELRELLVEIRGRPLPPGLGLTPDAPAKRPSIAERGRLWDLAVKLARELATEIDAGVAPAASSSSSAGGRGRGPARGRGVTYR